ncbi:MAG: peptidoglycan-binding protein [Parasporobacterium sp.]|nr:peptidoglycan-binding protein [Parasporobacterium sp.]
MKTRNAFHKTTALTMAALLGMAGTAFAAQPAPEAEPVQEAEPQVRTIGEAAETAVRFELTNKTGKDITWLTIYEDDGTDREKELVTIMQTALIEQGYLDDVADGSYGPKTKAAVKEFREKNGLSAEELMDEEMLSLLIQDYDDGNLLDDGALIKADETVVIFFEEAEDPQKQDEDAFLSNAGYIAQFRLAGEEDTEYVLHALALDGEPMQVLLEDQIPYVEYQTAQDGNLISTLETERAILFPPAPVYDYVTYDDGYYYEDPYYYDDGYYDDSYYEAPADVYYEPVVENDAQGADGCLEDDALTW